MGESNEMIEQVHKKVAQGFRCIKLKIGGLDFEEECDVLREIRATLSVQRYYDTTGRQRSISARRKLYQNYSC